MTRTILTTLAIAAAAVLTLPGAAGAAVICGFDDSEDRLSIVSQAATDQPAIVRTGNQITVLDAATPQDCTGPADATVTNTDEIAYASISASATDLTVDLGGGPLGPGATGEGQFGTPEIEIFVAGGAGQDGVYVKGSSGPDQFRAGTVETFEQRVNLTPLELIPDADIVATGVELIALLGEGGDDLLDARGGVGTGGPLAPHLYAFGGADDDALHAGAGSMYGYGNAGDDTLHGGDAADSMSPADGDDTVDGAGGSDTLFFNQSLPGIRVDLVTTTAQDTREGSDTLSGLEYVFGTSGDDVLRGNSAANALFSLEGDDVLRGRGGDDVLQGSDGRDTADYADASGAVSVVLGGDAPQGTGPDTGSDTLLNLEDVTGTVHADTLTGDGGENRLDGHRGADALDGEGGADTLIPGTGSEDEPEGADVVDGGPGVDTLSYAGRAGRVAVRLDGLGNDGADLNGDGFSSAAEEGDHAKGIENATGGAGADRFLATGVAANWFRGGGGADRLNGGPGADVLDGGAGADTLSYLDRTARVAVRLDGVKNDGADPNGDGFSAAGEENDHALGIENVIGGDGGDRILAPATGINVLTGGPGADFLEAKDGTATVDQLDCGTGGDTHRSDPADARTSCETAG